MDGKKYCQDDLTLSLNESQLYDFKKGYKHLLLLEPPTVSNGGECLVFFGSMRGQGGDCSPVH